MKKEIKGGIEIYHAEKRIPDDKLKSTVLGRHLRPSLIQHIITKNADVYDEDGKLLLRFRKNVLPKAHISEFYDATIDFAHTQTSNRGNATTNKASRKHKTQKRTVASNAKAMTNIIGYFDRMSVKQNWSLKRQGIKVGSMQVRESHFNMHYPKKFQRTIPLLRDIDQQYRRLTPSYYKAQKKKANQTPFHIADTAFTTITLNVNFQTTVHTDKGDDDDGFGNLSVIEHGKYTGGETCFPQYGIGVDVRTGDVLFMNVHKAHGNLPIKAQTKDAKRLSIVCYLRKKVWEKSRGMTRAQMLKHTRKLRNALGHGTQTRKSK